MRSLSMIPLPLRIAAIVLIGMLAFRAIGGALGSWLIILAMLLWVVVILTVLFDLGWANFFGKIPMLNRFFGFMTNAGAVTVENDPGPRGQLSDEDRAKLFANAQAQLNTLEGIDGVKEDVMERLIAPVDDDPENPFATQAPALVAVFSGPRGVGKSTVARACAHLFVGRGAIETANIVSVRPSDLRSGQHGSVTSFAKSKAEQAIGGTLLLEDVGWLLQDDGYGGPGQGSDFGAALLDVLERHPRRCLVVMTASAYEAAKLMQMPDNANWLSKLTIRTIEFPNLEDQTLLELLEQRLDDAGWALSNDEAAQQARRLMSEVRDRAGDSFDNAESCRRVAERLIEVARAEGSEASLKERLVERDVVRALDDQLE